jgi:hypothetical protein
LSSFESKGNGGTPTISINISGISNPVVDATEHEVIEANITDVEDTSNG